ncbi:putative fatty acyl-CoA reductase CG5065 isoform X1 [Eriocheir sinensis]|uniref:putative fatty acyl-CoA reductase CG5065 isoform X1 n=1 Tax=Eriocheir sinensis TaxID=95602 RepID=UPI0021C74561|nr:putative fatty acyl-CoA reductase CG5065 isoform X1 [Eriocheir sinensis]
MAEDGASEISEWYRGKNVFITGGSGFLGKVLLEKLLRTCPVRRIYLLMRPKRGVEVNQRLDDIFNYKGADLADPLSNIRGGRTNESTLFDGIKKTQPEVIQKVFAVRGDITMEGLGISDEDEARLVEEVNIVFHAAATINFQEPMRVAVNMNMLGTKRVVSLAKKMKNLQSLVYVSTAYSNCHLPEVYEELYPAPIDPSRLIQLTEWLDDDLLETLTPKLVQPRPNTYTYTKALAEHLLVTDGARLPISIVRPSIVCGSWREPMPGWVDNLFAFTGLLVGMSKGVLRSLYIKPGITLDFIPVDFPINLMIVSAWNTAAGRYKPSSVPIFCCSTGTQKPLTSDDLAIHLEKSVRAFPFNSPLWYPDGSAKTNKFMHQLHINLVNILPAHLADTIMRMIGKKPIAVNLCNKMVKAVGALEYFMLRDWVFHNTRSQCLWDTLSPTDQEIYHFDIDSLDWGAYIETYQKGCKQYIMKEELKDLPKARRNMRKMHFFHRLVQLIMMYGVWCLLASESATHCYSVFFRGAAKMLSLPVLAAAEEFDGEGVELPDGVEVDDVAGMDAVL